MEELEKLLIDKIHIGRVDSFERPNAYFISDDDKCYRLILEEITTPVIRVEVESWLFGE